MADNEIFVEERAGSYVALENGHVIVNALTQAKAGERAHTLRPHATIFADAQRAVNTGDPDQRRILHHPHE